MKVLDVDRAAPVASIVVNAPVETVWHFLAGIEEWPDWNAGVTHVSVSSPISVGTEFRWKAGGLPIRSRLEVFDPMRFIGWTGTAPLIYFKYRALNKSADRRVFRGSACKTVSQMVRQLDYVIP